MGDNIYIDDVCEIEMYSLWLIGYNNYEFERKVCYLHTSYQGEPFVNVFD